VRFAYADPPYIGQAKRHYSSDPNAAEVNHRLLIGYLCDSFDAWALSLSSPSLRLILPLCPDDVRIAAWVKPFASFKPGVRLAYAWEPVILRGARKGTREDSTVRDWVGANITLERGLSGAKPYGFCAWLFEALGAQPVDDFTDVFPGSGAVTRAWESWRAARSAKPLQLEATP
jgi:hypothetical protein